MQVAISNVRYVYVNWLRGKLLRVLPVTCVEAKFHHRSTIDAMSFTIKTKKTPNHTISFRSVHPFSSLGLICHVFDIFTGIMNRDYEVITSRIVTEMNHYDGTGSAMSIIANRVSFTFNLTGPSLVIDTACSSFLFALHYALQAIKSGNGIEEMLDNEIRIATISVSYSGHLNMSMFLFYSRRL